MIRTILSCLLLCAFVLHLAEAQSFFGGLRGAVTDPGGAAVPLAKVSLIDESTGAERSTLTTQEGEFAFNQVVPSTYSLRVESPGFRVFERKGVAIATQQFTTVNVQLEVGQVTETVNVTEEAPLLETGSASQGQVVDRQKLIDLPNLGRNPFMMSRLAQNVVQVGNPAYNRMQDQSGSSQISIAGGPVRGNNYLLDGIPITDALNRAIIIPSLEAVEEVKIQASTYDAEMARTGGGMFNTYLKSGGNTYHGSAFGYIRETEWAANTFFNNRAGLPRVDNPNRTWGGSLGGHLSIPRLYNGRNRTFWWSAWEAYSDTQATSAEFAVPTMKERAGDFSSSFARTGGMQVMYDPLTTRNDGSRDPFAGNIIPASRIDPVGRNIAATYMPPSREARFFGDQNISAASRMKSKADQKTLKVDHQMTSWWRSSVSYLRYYSLEPGEDWFPTVSSPAQWKLMRRVDATQWNNLMTLNSSTILNVRYGFNRFPNFSFQKSLGYDPAQLGFSPAFLRDVTSYVFPNIAMETLHSLGTNSNSYYVHHSKNFSANASHFRGIHSLKAGFDFRRINADGIDLGNSSGAFSFNDQFTRALPGRAVAGTGSDLASMLLGYPASGSGFVSNKLFNYADYYALYVHDDIRLFRTVTLNLGVRWERENGLAERNNALITGFDRDAVNPISAGLNGFTAKGAVQFAGVGSAPRTVGNPNLHKWGPRAGVAWQVSPSMTVRAGYGLYWAPQFAIGAPYTPEGYTASTPYVGSNDNGFTPAGILSNPFPSGLNKPTGNALGALTGIGRSLSLFDPDARSPRVHQFSFDIQRQFRGGIVASAGYVGSRTHHLVLGTASININMLPPEYFSLGAALNERVANPFFGRGGAGVVGAPTIARQQLLRPFAAFGDINLLFSDQNRARYDSMVLKVQKRLDHGLSLLATYTFSKMFDASSGGAGNNLNQGAAGPQNPFDMAAEYALSNVDTPHRFSSGLTWQLPGERLKPRRALYLLAGGWSVNAVTVYQSGFPLQIRQNSNNNSVIGAASQRPNATGVSPATEGSTNARLDNWINPAAFSQASPFTFGNVSRTIGLRGPGIANWDISLFKTASITETYKLQFRAEAMNALNTPLFRSPNTAYGNAAFGRITSQANFPRLIQLGLRFYF
ncbi:MAG: hypothetical protein KatS3mg005_1591 [Bryobacteraceae bacterium]|nr:MAG: hypothetical protein KatS3mg005_1591 [Bryobacteraceae bacterium]